MIMFSLIWLLSLNLILNANAENVRQLKEKPPSPSSATEKRFHLKWISDQTVFPFSFQLPHYDKELVEYDWYKYDSDTYVTKLDNYRPNYFVSKQPYKTKLSIFSYDAKTHDQLTTYEPRRVFDYSDAADKPKHQDLFTLLLLQSHRIRIDRGVNHANVTCLADFLIDKNSMIESSIDLLQQIKDLAMFNMNLNDEMRKYYQERPGKQTWTENHMLNYKKANRIGYGTQSIWYQQKSNSIKLARRRFRQQRSLFYYDNNDLNSNLYDYETDYGDKTKTGKSFYKIRLGLGPVRIEEPFEQSLISCDLDLINADDVNLDHRSKVFKYLFKEDIGIDKDEIDKEDEEGFVIVSELSESYESVTVKPVIDLEKTSTISTVVTQTTPDINTFIPRYLADSNETIELDIELTSTTTEQSNEMETTTERIKKPTLLFLLDNPNQKSASLNSKSSQISSLNYLFILILNLIFTIY